MTTTTEVKEREQRYYSPEEYLELEAAAEFRSEYDDGRIIPMPGGTPNHNRIALNLSAALNLAFKKQTPGLFSACHDKN